MKPQHLTRGWTWRADIDGDRPTWGIYGHLTDDEAIAAVKDYEMDDPEVDPPAPRFVVTRDWRRTMPCPRTRGLDCDPECDGPTHLEHSDTPGSSPYTWVEVAP